MTTRNFLLKYSFSRRIPIIRNAHSLIKKTDFKLTTQQTSKTKIIIQPIKIIFKGFCIGVFGVSFLFTCFFTMFYFFDLLMRTIACFFCGEKGGGGKCFVDIINFTVCFGLITSFFYYIIHGC